MNATPEWGNAPKEIPGQDLDQQVSCLVAGVVARVIPLVKPRCVHYFQVMLRKCGLALVAAVLGIAAAGGADVIQLKDKAAVSGRILAEKPDQVVLDLGYTVLLVPREQIAKITRGEVETSVKRVASPKASDASPIRTAAAAEMERNGFYTPSSRAGSARSVRELVTELGESVVQVRTPSALGSGFIINEEGFLLTNFHVIEGETQISIELYLQRNGQLERKTCKQVRIVAMNKFQDLALLKIDDKDAPKFRAVVLGNSDALAVGEGVFAIGSPLGLERTVTEGILSTKTRQMAGELYLQTTAQINPGNSGGPLFNLSGEVVGITNMKITFGEGLGFAIPVEAVKFFLDHRDAYAYANDNPSNAYRYLEPPSRARIPVPE
jgi:serine protease Do